MSDAARYENIDMHFCSPKCENCQTPCSLCMGQRRKRQSDLDLAEARPTLRYSPFADLLRKLSEEAK